MLAAYLRGLLKPSHDYGIRSHLAESAILEALSAELTADSYRHAAIADASMLPALTSESASNTMRVVAAQLSRASELKCMDVYRLEQTSRNSGQQQISLYQLYQALQKGGILASLRERADVFIAANTES